MHIEKLLFSLFLAALCSVVIKYSSDSFEAASSFLGRHMAPGIKGATINAVGSSMPELLTTAVFLFLYRDIDGFSAGVATAAGSAVFNGLIIPALCIFVVTLCGVKKSTETVRVEYIEVDSRTILRDGVWLVIGEVMLIVFLGDTTLTWVAGLLLLLCYAGYFTHLMYQNRRYGSEIGGGDGAEEDHKSTVPSGKLRALITFDFKTLFYKGKSFTDGRAWVVLWASIVVLSAACILLAKAVIESAQALSIPTYFTAVVLAAAATSVPDTVLSIKDARRGLYDDAISNALGSNIFDITVSLGLPLFI